MSEAVPLLWRSPVDLPRDGTVVVVLLDRAPAVSDAECVRYGVCDGRDAWLTSDGGGLHTWANDKDFKIIGWFPVPQIQAWIDWAEAP